jgi:thiol-disulfide isomerase/thioredoxin
LLGLGLTCVLAILSPVRLAASEPTDANAARPAIDRGLGQRLGNFTLNDAESGRPYSLYGFAGKKAAVLVFMGTECPLVKLYSPRLAELNKEYRGKDVVFLGIFPNAHEDEAAIRDHARSHGIDFLVFKDRGNAVADLAMIERTPEVVLLDGRAKVRYRGAIDDQYGQGTRKADSVHHYLKDALDALLESKPIATTATTAPGCLIDRAEVKQPVVARQRIRPASNELQDAYDAIDAGASHEVGEVTYASNVAKILQEKCQSCHRPGEVAPFSLQTYDDARKHSAMIREVVDNRRMPPWHADPRHGSFANDRSLTPIERDTLLAWVDQGSPLGDPSRIPAPKTFAEGWTIGTPDLVFEMPKDYTVPAQGVLDYVRFRVPTNFTEDKWIQAAEAQPGDRSVVHHIVAYVDTHKDKDSKSDSGDLDHLCAYAPGDLPSQFPLGTAKKIPAGADLILELHYTPIGQMKIDRSRIGLILAKEPVTREAKTIPILRMDFIIPPGEDNVGVSASMTLPFDVRLLSLFPHMHLRGKDFRYNLTIPGQPERTLLSVPAYDFGWQSYYILDQPLDLPKGSRIDCLAHYDNSSKNPSNPDPSKLVRWGDQTFDEMMIGYIDIDFPIKPPSDAQSNAGK